MARQTGKEKRRTQPTAGCRDKRGVKQQKMDRRGEGEGRRRKKKCLEGGPGRVSTIVKKYRGGGEAVIWIRVR